MKRKQKMETKNAKKQKLNPYLSTKNPLSLTKITILSLDLQLPQSLLVLPGLSLSPLILLPLNIRTPQRKHNENQYPQTSQHTKQQFPRKLTRPSTIRKSFFLFFSF